MPARIALALTMALPLAILPAIAPVRAWAGAEIHSM